MKQLLSLVVIASLLFAMVPAAFAVSIGGPVNPVINPEEYAPNVWMCDNRVVYDDNTEPGRITDPGENLIEREHNYAFEGEKITWDVLVMDKNGIQKVQDVFATVGDVQGEGNPIESNCYEKVNSSSIVEPSCNARILEEDLTGRPINTMTQRYYTCELTVETPESMYGEYWMTVEAVDLDGLSGTMDENEYWFLNPVIALSIDGDLEFDNVRPGTSSYSSTLLVGNDADVGSGVMMDMFITGTDFYDSSSSGAACPTTNQLALENFRYYATNGFYSTQIAKDRSSTVVADGPDPEGYMNIAYGVGFNDPNPFYGRAEIMPTRTNNLGKYSEGNVLSPGNEMAITFKLELPEPCNGNFDSGALYFWGEAI